MGVLDPYLADIWLFIIGFFLLYYAVTDGFGLGIGIISLFCRNDQERELMMNSIASVWHQNQTWLVLLGGMLFGAFPLFYGVVLSSLYIPILIMLFGLIFRGVAFEFREQSQRKSLWCLSFGLGSLIAALGQGLALGGLLGGSLIVENGKFVGSAWGWLEPFSILVAAGVLFGYAMLGANYLILKTSGQFQEKWRRYAWVTSLVTLMLSVIVHLWIITRYPHVGQKWMNLSENHSVLGFSLLAVLAYLMFLHSLWRRGELSPLFWNILIILCSFIGLSVGMHPVMIPNLIASPVTVLAAAASPKTLRFMLVVIVILLPVILSYTAYTQRAFRGKVSAGYSQE
jgi:cytochrome d ubiquinol oxidase subunit II